MIPIDFELFTLLYLLTGGLLIFGLWVFYEWRDRALYAPQRAVGAFHCVRCGALYTGSTRKMVSCPRCGMENASLRF